jgi:hypothetical protein
MGRGDITRKKGLALEGLHVEDHGSAQKEPRGGVVRQRSEPSPDALHELFLCKNMGNED